MSAGIVSWGTYLPYWRLQRAAIAGVLGAGPPERQITTVGPGRTLGLTHNLGGAPGEGVSFVGIVGTELDD